MKPSWRASPQTRPQPRLEVHQRGPKQEAGCGYTNLFVASETPRPPAGVLPLRNSPALVTFQT